jgi:hypothetical protein
LLKRIADRKVTIVIDACHSGTATRGSDDNAPGTAKCLCAVLDDYDPRPLVTADRSGGVRSTRSATTKQQGFIERRDNVVAWSAVNDGQLALVDTESAEPQSVFTRRFIAGVTQGAATRRFSIIWSMLITFVYAAPL